MSLLNFNDSMDNADFSNLFSQTGLMTEEDRMMIPGYEFEDAPTLCINEDYETGEKTLNLTKLEEFKNLGIIVEISGLKLTSSKVYGLKYENMFLNCWALTDLSNFEIPSISAFNRSYTRMFGTCVNLRVPPKINTEYFGNYEGEGGSFDHGAHDYRRRLL